jgi:hypothetical protein
MSIQPTSPIRSLVDGSGWTFADGSGWTFADGSGWT